MVIIKRLYLILLLTSIIYAIAAVGMLELPTLDFKSTNYLMIGGALIAQLAFWAFISIGWSRAIYYVTAHKINTLESFSQISMLLIGKYLPGKVWGMIARGAVLKELSIETRDIIKCTYTEQLISIHAGLFIGAVGLALNYETSHQWLIFLSALISLFLIPMLNNKFNHAINHLFKRLKKTQEPFNITIPYSHYTILFLLYALEWLAIGAILLFLLLGFLPITLTTLEAAQTISFAATGMLIGFAALFAPGGIGIRESVITYFLSTIIPLESAIFIAVIYRAWLTCADILAGVIVLLLSGAKKMQ